jgi:hypothetical protein
MGDLVEEIYIEIDNKNGKWFEKISAWSGNK